MDTFKFVRNKRSRSFLYLAADLPQRLDLQLLMSAEKCRAPAPCPASCTVDLKRAISDSSSDLDLIRRAINCSLSTASALY